MNCRDVKENLIELLAEGIPEEGLNPRSATDPAVVAHVRACAVCAQELESLRKTMTLLDEWDAPEPSPYFMSRFRAQLRSEQEKQPRGWLGWLRRPAMAVGLATILAAGGLLYPLLQPHTPAPPPPPGTAVADLQALERNYDFYANFDLLDEVTDQQQMEMSQ